MIEHLTHEHEALISEVEQYHLTKRRLADTAPRMVRSRVAEIVEKLCASIDEPPPDVLLLDSPLANQLACLIMRDGYPTSIFQPEIIDWLRAQVEPQFDLEELCVKHPPSRAHLLSKLGAHKALETHRANRRQSEGYLDILYREALTCVHPRLYTRLLDRFHETDHNKTYCHSLHLIWRDLWNGLPTNNANFTGFYSGGSGWGRVTSHVYEFLKRLQLLTGKATQILELYQTFLDCGEWGYRWHGNLLIINNAPCEFHCSDEGRGILHCESGPALRFRDGYRLYCRHGKFSEPHHLSWSPVHG